MTPGSGIARGTNLRRAASVVFALVAVLPLLLSVYLLSRANLLQYTETQVGLLLALAIAVLGFAVFRRTVGQVARLAQDLQATPARAPAGAAPVPALGQVTEIAQVAGAFYHMLGDLRGATHRLEDLVFKLGSLNEMVQLAAHVPRIQDLLALVLQTTMSAVHATIGSIMILDKQSGTLRLSASRGIPDDVAEHAVVKVGEGIAGKVVELGEPVLVDDIETDPRFKQPNAPRYGTGSFICMPIRAGDRVVGVINMAKRRETADPGEPRLAPFSSIDLQFLNALMTYIGYAVDNARLLEEAQDSARRLQIVVDDLKLTQERLVRGETLRAMGQLASGMAHHLNNLFAVILGRTELLLAGAESPGVRRSLEVVQRAARDGAEVARRVQRFSRLQPAMESTAVDLNEIAQDAVELTRSRLGEEVPLEERFVEFAMEPGPIPAVAADPTQLREVVMNVLQNATEAMPYGGKVTVRTWAAEERVYCAISDTGIGMSEEVRRRALEPFFTTKGPKTTGLGLSIAYGALQRSGGTLAIDSAPGQGTTLTLSLVASGLPPAPREPAAAPGRSLRILVVDGDTPAREALADALVARGHRVIQAADARVGIGLLRAGEPFDVVLVDLRLPGTSAWDLVQAIRGAWPRLAIGVVARPEESLTSEQSDRADFALSSPIDPALLDAALASVPDR
jgi:signal transduction histidine kinase/CheY-like chemotaxis protein